MLLCKKKKKKNAKKNKTQKNVTDIPPIYYGHFTFSIAGVGIFGAFFLLLLIVTETVPPSALSIPLIGVYHISNMILIVVAMFLSSIVAKLYEMDGVEGCHMPTVLKRVKGLFTMFTVIRKHLW